MTTPPINYARHSEWPQRLAPLRKSPGKWQIIFEGSSHGSASAMASKIKTGQVKGCEAGEFDATSRTLETGEYVVYAMFLGKSCPECKRPF